MITTETYGCDRHGEDAYQGCAMCDLEALRTDYALLSDDYKQLVLYKESLRSRLAEAKAKADKDVIARNRVIAEKSARLAEAEVLLMEAREFVFGLTRIDDLRDRIDAHLSREEEEKP